MTITIASKFGIQLDHNFITKKSSDKLMILLPGRGYTIAAPLMRYIGQIGRSHGYDVLYVSYAIHMTHVDNWLTRVADIFADTQAVVNQVDLSVYESVCVVGKSLGTMVACQLLSQVELPNPSMLMLTPIQNAMSLISEVRALAIIGTNDPAYNPDHVNNTSFHEWKVYDNLNHSLEIKGEWEQSLGVLIDILKDCEQFIAS